MKKVSILIPAYNCEQEIYHCVRSLLEQTCSDFEVIAVDDGSQDRTGSRLDFYARLHPDQFRIIHQSNRGVAAARNAALDAARGEYVLFLDSDDWLRRRAVATLLETARTTQADVVICGYVSEGIVSRKHQVQRTMMPHRRTLMKMLMRDRQVRNYAWGKLIRRNLFDGLRFWDRRLFEDVELMHKVLLRSEKTVLIPDLLMHYHLRRSHSLTRSLSPQGIRDMLDAFAIQAESITAYDPSLSRQARQMKRRAAVMAAMFLVVRGYWNGALWKELFQPRRVAAVSRPLNL